MIHKTREFSIYLEPADETSLVAKRKLLLITTIQPDQRSLLGTGRFKGNSAQKTYP